MSDTFCNGRYHKNVDERGSVTFTHQGDLVGVAAEGCYVLLDPVQRRHEVEQSVVSRRIAVLRTQETFQQTVIIASSQMSFLAKLIHACFYDEM